jgi:branched-chain amino acid transport system permease protein
MGSIVGAVIAAFAVGLINSYAGFVLDDSWARIIIYLLLYLALLIRPQGLLGKREAL